MKSLKPSMNDWLFGFSWYAIGMAIAVKVPTGYTVFIQIMSLALILLWHMDSYSKGLDRGIEIACDAKSER